MTLNPKSRWSAFGIHLVISIAVLLVLLLVIFFVWFPHDLINAGGVRGLRILTVVALVTGPLLTLLVYRPGKKSLRFDLSAITLLQLACMLAGVWLIYNQRPLVQVLADDGVHLIAASDFKAYEVTLVDFPGPSPKHIMLDIPENHSELAAVKFTSDMITEKPFTFRTDLYLPMSELDQQRFNQRIAFIREHLDDAELTRLSIPEKLDCSWVPLHAAHFSGCACTNFTRGIVSLADQER
ncbi:MAG: hypothetical protein HKN85_03660 [Gammaproteobacteria bacterium]|nr:hypothetical protein [Gammaproteobacteria bacterium]